MKRLVRAFKRYVRQLAFIAVLLCVWEAFSWWNPFNWPTARGVSYPYLFPPPSVVAKTFIELLVSGELLRHTTVSMERVFMGFGIGVALGIPVGVLIARYRVAEDTLDVLVKALHPIPGIAWLPLAILWFGLGTKAIVFIVITGAFFPVAINTTAGIKNVDPVLIRAAKTMGADGAKLFLKVMLPGSLPHVVSGLRIAWAFSWRALAAGELVGASSGLGYLLNVGRFLHDMPMVISTMLTIGFLGYIIERFIFRTLEAKTIERWGLARQA